MSRVRLVNPAQLRQPCEAIETVRRPLPPSRQPIGRIHLIWARSTLHWSWPAPTCRNSRWLTLRSMPVATMRRSVAAAACSMSTSTGKPLPSARHCSRQWNDLESLKGVQVVRIAGAGLASLADIAAHLGRTRESVRLLVSGARGPGGFPKPVTDPRSRFRLWHWSEVVQWFERYRGEVQPQPEGFAAMCNAALELRHGRQQLDPSDDVTLRELLGASLP